MKHTLMGLMMVAFLGAPGVEAQETATVQVGDSVRVLFRNLDLTGTLLRITGDSVLLQSTDGERTIGIGSGEGLYLGVPRSRAASAGRRMVRGALVDGLSVGVVAGLAALAIVDCVEDYEGPCESQDFRGDWVLGAAATLGALGAIWGALSPSVDWRPAVLPARGLTVRPSFFNGPGVSARLTLGGGS